jgi:signal transduction histidine kinase
MNGDIFWPVAAVAMAIVAVAAWISAGRRGSRLGALRYTAPLQKLLTELRRRGSVSPAGQDEPQAVRDLRAEVAEHWTPKGQELTEAMEEALGRIGKYLNESVAGPLQDGLEGDARALRDGAETALGAAEDLGFFLEDLPHEGESGRQSLQEQVQTLTHEFAQGSDVMVSVRAPDRPIMVELATDSFQDALYLILHNAAEFGGGKTVDVLIRSEDERASVVIADQGPGFSAEALARAYDPFYSTTPGGLGLGLPHARRLLSSMGGDIHLRNRDGGGAEVEVSFPVVG